MPFTAHRDSMDFPPVVIERGEGVYLYGADGRRYMDAIGSWWVSLFGHGNREIGAAIKEQADRLDHVHMAGCVSTPTLELTEQLMEIMPSNITKIFYSDDGSTAVEAAMKIALQYHAIRGSSRREFVALGGGYHGDTLGAMSVGSIPQYHDIFHSRFKIQHFTDRPYCFRCPLNKEPETCSADCMDSLSDILERCGERVAAFVFEPMVQCAAGMHIYPPKVLRRIFDLCNARNIITIADEVATGLGRTGTMFACDHAGVTPDIICIAKGMTGGYLPMAATAVSADIYDEFKGNYTAGERVLNHGHTFTGNPLSSSAAAAAIKFLRRNGYPESARGTMEYFHKSLLSFGDEEHIAGIRSLGFIGAFEIVGDKRTKERFPPNERVSFRITRRALELGLILRPLGDTVYFMPPFNITHGEVDTMFELAKAAVRETLR